MHPAKKVSANRPSMMCLQVPSMLLVYGMSRSKIGARGGGHQYYAQAMRLKPQQQRHKVHLRGLLVSEMSRAWRLCVCGRLDYAERAIRAQSQMTGAA